MFLYYWVSREGKWGQVVKQKYFPHCFETNEGIWCHWDHSLNTIPCKEGFVRIPLNKLLQIFSFTFHCFHNSLNFFFSCFVAFSSSCVGVTALSLWKSDAPGPERQIPTSRSHCLLLTGSAAVTTPGGFGLGHRATASPGAHSTFSTAGCRTATPCVCLWGQRDSVHTNSSEPGAVWPSASFYLSLLFTARPSGPMELCITETADQELTCGFLGIHSCCWACPVDWSWGGMWIIFSLDTYWPCNPAQALRWWSGRILVSVPGQVGFRCIVMKASVPCSAAWENRLRFCFKNKTEEKLWHGFPTPILQTGGETIPKTWAFSWCNSVLFSIQQLEGFSVIN